MLGFLCILCVFGGLQLQMQLIDEPPGAVRDCMSLWTAARVSLLLQHQAPAKSVIVYF